MTRKEEQATLLALVAWVTGWGLWAVGLDTSITAADSVTSSAVKLHQLLRACAWGQLGAWINLTEAHPPLPFIVAGLLSAPLGGGTFGVRMSMVLLHAVAVLQVHRLGRTVSGDGPTAALAALLTAVTPILAGLFRLDFHEPVTTVIVLATLQWAVTLDLHRQRRRALLLGLTAGLGALSKLAYPAVLLPPALIFLATRVRSARAALNAALALVVCLAVAGWWYLGHFSAITSNWQISTSTQSAGVAANLLGYLVAPTSNALLTAAAVVGIALAWRRRSMAPGALLLLASTWSLGYAVFLLVFDFWIRYILILLPLSALFAAVAGAAAVRQVPARWRRAAGLSLAATVCGLSSLATVTHEPGDRRTGLLVPDRRERNAFSRGLGLLASLGGPALWTTDSDEAYHELTARLDLREARAQEAAIDWLSLDQARQRLARGSLHALVVTTRPGQGNREGVWQLEGRQAWRLVGGRPKRLIGRFEDQSPFIVSVYRLQP